MLRGSLSRKDLKPREFEIVEACQDHEFYVTDSVSVDGVAVTRVVPKLINAKDRCKGLTPKDFALSNLIAMKVSLDDNMRLSGNEFDVIDNL